MGTIDLAVLENKRLKLNQTLSEFGSPNIQLFYLSQFLNELLAFENTALVDAYFSEFTSRFSMLTKIYSPVGIDPDRSDELINLVERFISFLDGEEKEEFEKIKNSLSIKIEEIKKSLLGISDTSNSNKNLQFPVLEKNEEQNFLFGFLESISINISKRSNLSSDSFFIVPDLGERDNRVTEQLNNSWNAALEYLKRSGFKTNGFHEVVIRFDKKYGIYEGSSFGIVLTIGFIQELIHYYNLRKEICFDSAIASTGSVSGDGTVTSVGKDSIIKKTEVIFYSRIRKFIIPLDDLNFAFKKFEQLKQLCPQRKLELIGISSVDDILDRRSLINIKTQNIIPWAFKKTLQNKFAASLLLLLLLSSSFFIVKDFDSNPVEIDYRSSSGTGLIKNKYGKTLWKISDFPVLQTGYLSSFFIKKVAKIIDVTGDGENEVLYSAERKNGSLICYRNDGEILWRYNYRRTISTPVETFSDIYRIHTLVDVVKKDGINELTVIAQEAHHYPNPILKLNAATGELINDSFWHPGGIQGAFINDIDNDGKNELVAAGISNGMKCAFLFSIEYDKLRGTAPTHKNYTFLNQSIADFDFYVLIPKSDLSFAVTHKYNAVINSPRFEKEKKIIEIKTIEDIHGFRNYPMHLVYDFLPDFSDVLITVPEAFAYKRDSLINAGAISGPSSGSYDYKLKLKRNLRLWNGKNSFRCIIKYYCINSLLLIFRLIKKINSELYEYCRFRKIPG